MQRPNGRSQLSCSSHTTFQIVLLLYDSVSDCCCMCSIVPKSWLLFEKRIPIEAKLMHKITRPGAAWQSRYSRRCRNPDCETDDCLLLVNNTDSSICCEISQQAVICFTGLHRCLAHFTPLKTAGLCVQTNSSTHQGALVCVYKQKVAYYSTATFWTPMT